MNHAGLKRVVKTVRTKKGVKRQTFWVRAEGDQKPGLLRRAAKIAGKAALGAAALGAVAYGAHKVMQHGRGPAHAPHGGAQMPHQGTRGGHGFMSGPRHAASGANATRTGGSSRTGAPAHETAKSKEHGFFAGVVHAARGAARARKEQ